MFFYDNAISTPIVNSVAYTFSSCSEAEAIFNGSSKKPLYARMGNPTTSKLESELTIRENAVGCVATSSGMGAVSMVITSLLESGDEIISIGGLFGGNYTLFTQTLYRFGIKTHCISMDALDTLEEYINKNTKVIFCESVGNPSLRLAPIDKIAKIANKWNIAFVVDNTTTPFLFPLKYGADIVLYSTTKIITGNASALGGAALFRAIKEENEKFKSDRYKFLRPLIEKMKEKALVACARKRSLRDFGMSANANASYQTLLGLESLELRNDKIQETSKIVVENLYNEGLNVNHPTLHNNIDYEIYKRLYMRGTSPLFTLDLDTKERVYKFLDSIKGIILSVNFGDTRTLALHMQSTIYRDFTLNEQEFLGVSPGLIRFSVGLEQPEFITQSILESYYAL